MTRRSIFQDAETKSLAEVLSSVGEDKKAMILSGFKLQYNSYLVARLNEKRPKVRPFFRTCLTKWRRKR